MIWLHGPIGDAAHSQARHDWDGRHTCGRLFSSDTKPGPLTKRSQPCPECYREREKVDSER